MKKSVIIPVIFIIFILLQNNAYAQNAPLTTCATINNAAPGSISVPVTVSNFNNIGAISLSVDYDYSVMHFDSGTPNGQLGAFVIGDNDLFNGFHRISMGWYGQGTSLPNGSTLMTLTFIYIDGNSAITWFDNGSSCEYADAQYNILNDIPTSNYYFNGYVCGGLQAPGNINGPSIVCQGMQGIAYSIDPVMNASGYHWTVPNGAEIISGQGTDLILVDYSLNSSSGNVEVYGTNACGNGPSTQLPVTVTPLPIADPGNDFTINYGTSTTLQAASGGPGNYSYHWSPEYLLVDPDVQNPQTVILTSTTLFTLLVTDLISFCQSTGEVIVTIVGGPLGASPVADPGSICAGQSSCLYANAGGGSGSYTYLWNCIPPGDPPWSSTLANPVVSPDSSKTYQVLVNDGFTNATGSVDLQVFQLPTATISGGDSLCGYGSTTLLPVELTGTGPWNFTYTFGNTSVFIYSQNISPYYILAAEAGTYAVPYVEDANCTGISYGSAEVFIFPVPATPEVTYSNLELHSNACCGNQWYLNDVAIPGATGQNYAVTQSGSYYDIVTLYGCSSDASEMIDVIVGISEFNNIKISLFPNPANEITFLTYNPEEIIPVSIVIYFPDGRKAMEKNISGISSERRLAIDLGHLPAGLYFLEVVSNQSASSMKLIIK